MQIAKKLRDAAAKVAEFECPTGMEGKVEPRYLDCYRKNGHMSA